MTTDPKLDREWSRRKLATLFVLVAALSVLMVVGLVLALVAVVAPAGRRAHSQPSGGPVMRLSARDDLAQRAMPSVDPAASHPQQVSTADPPSPILLMAGTSVDSAGVSTGFPHTSEGALAQLASIDRAAMDSGSLAAARLIITRWALRGGPTASTWSVISGLASLIGTAGTSAQLSVVLTPLMGLIKGSVGVDFVIPCVDFELDVTVTQTARGAVADCQRMQWAGHDWEIAVGSEPATPPSVWPDTDVAFAVGYRDLITGRRNG